MEIFDETPVSFNINRKSPLASKLKSSISRKLIHLIGDFTDDVLAEYITVLVCNGKDQIQAKDDLEAFLGKRSGAFVSWLWGQLFRYKTYASPSSSDADMDLRSTRSQDVHAHRNTFAGRSLTKNCNIFQKTSCDSPNEMELSEFTENSKKPSGTYKEQLRKDRSVSRKAADIAEKHGGDTLRPSAVTTGRTKGFERADIHKLNEKEMARQISDFPRREMALKSLEYSNAQKEEVPQGREIYAANISARNPLTSYLDVPCQTKVLRGSVWDRLGKPCEENSVVNDMSLEAYAGDTAKKHNRTQDRPKLPFPAHNENFDLNTKHGVRVVDKSSEAHCSSRIDRKCEQKASTIVKPYSGNNTRQKRSHSEIISNPNSLSASVDQHCVDDHLKEGSHDSKKMNSSMEKLNDVRQKLQEMEMEMSKLRSKQLGMSKEGRPHLILSSGVFEHSFGDANSRTVFVSNVHFAVTKEILSSHFAKCGGVSGVIFSDNVKGSAYITFASKDSVEKALALNGISLMSRPLKVVRKGEETTSTTFKPPLGAVKSLIHPQPVIKLGKTSLDKPSNLPRGHHHLQWRREPISAPSEPSQA